MPKSAVFKVVKGKTYRINTDPSYWWRKYGDKNPEITIEDEHKKVFGKWWGLMTGNPACLLFAMRTLHIQLPDDGQKKGSIFYGKVKGMGELIHISELEEINGKEKG